MDSRLRLLTAVREVFAERVFGRAHALASLPEYLEFQAAARAVWMPTQCHGGFESSGVFTSEGSVVPPHLRRNFP